MVLESTACLECKNNYLPFIYPCGLFLSYFFLCNSVMTCSVSGQQVFDIVAFISALIALTLNPWKSSQ